MVASSESSSGCGAPADCRVRVFSCAALMIARRRNCTRVKKCRQNVSSEMRDGTSLYRMRSNAGKRPRHTRAVGTHSRKWKVNWNSSSVNGGRRRKLLGSSASSSNWRFSSPSRCSYSGGSSHGGADSSPAVSSAGVGMSTFCFSRAKDTLSFSMTVASFLVIRESKDSAGGAEDLASRRFLTSRTSSVASFLALLIVEQRGSKTDWQAEGGNECFGTWRLPGDVQGADLARKSV
mmetsp:Transcript_2324/g.5521  ORF Transcript_2324/g.5521 Transcript_2324/m.5521 type:complete len:235 (+) Transcript_2324:99-803(+)